MFRSLLVTDKVNNSSTPKTRVFYVRELWQKTWSPGGGNNNVLWTANATKLPADMQFAHTFIATNTIDDFIICIDLCVLYLLIVCVYDKLNKQL